MAVAEHARRYADMVGRHGLQAVLEMLVRDKLRARGLMDVSAPGAA